MIETPFATNPFRSSAQRSFRFCIPDEWFRRSKPRSVSSASLEPSESTIKQYAELQGSEAEGSSDGEDTAKARKSDQIRRPENERRDSPDWRSSLSQSRLSNLFEGWGNSPGSNSTARGSVVFPPERINVSEPKLVEHRTGSGEPVNTDHGPAEDNEAEPDRDEFEQMLVSCIRALKRPSLMNQFVE